MTLQSPGGAQKTGTCPFGFDDADADAGKGATTAVDDFELSSTDSGAPVPVADWVDPLEMMADPCPTYARLRSEAPVAWVPSLNKYLITSYEGCHEVETDQQIYSANVSGATMTRALGARPMLRKDDPEHADDRKAVNPTLRPKNIKEAWAPVFEKNARTDLGFACSVPCTRKATPL